MGAARLRYRGISQNSIASDSGTPPKLQRIVDLFAGAPKDLRLQALLEYSRKVPPLPEHLAGHRDQMEQVVECQTPFFLATEVDDDRHVHLFFDVPAEAPTTRGFAGILREGLEGARAEEVLATPDDFYDELGLAEVISSLRLRGMSAILFRLKRQVRESLAASSPGGAGASPAV
ncbi:MAG: cysteine desulfuration protein SufE [Actinomycetota bacterium]|nr:cysteine desulfuration protein SufE [Actinomycetota bacterium]